MSSVWPPRGAAPQAVTEPGGRGVRAPAGARGAPAATGKEQRLQAQRLRMTALSVVNFLLQSGILALYAALGRVSWGLVASFLVASMAASGGFWLLIRSGRNTRFADPGMLLPQIVVSWLVQVVFLALAPQLAVVFLVSLLVGFVYAMIAFDERQFIIAWLLQAAMTAAAMAWGWHTAGAPGWTVAELAVAWLLFFLCTYRITAIGAQFSSLRAKLSEKNRLLSESLARIAELASHDDLTGALNRRSFMQLLEAERARLGRAPQPFSVALLDLDHFKSINDRHGHLAGDAVLKALCGVVGGALRGTDVFARYGGEEFVLLLHAPIDAATTWSVLERVRLRIERHDWDAIAPGLAVTASIGMAVWSGGQTAQDLLGQADKALYDAKRRGRNRVMPRVLPPRHADGEP